MFTFNIEHFVPKFILNDQNGYALVKAIGAAMQMMNDTIYDGTQVLTDVDTMPEWRLDELAWEYNLIYDYNADIESKRGWIRDMRQNYSLYGTIAGIVKYLEAVFDSASVDEAGKQYVGDPFHFLVNVTGIWSDENEAWARKAIEEVKNVRSILDRIVFNAGQSAAEYLVGAAVAGVEIVLTSKTL